VQVILQFFSTINEAHRFALQQGFDSSDVDVALTFNKANADKIDVNPSLKRAVLLETFLTSASRLESSDDGDLLPKPLSLDSDPPPGRTLHADISYTPDIKAPNAQNNSHTPTSNLRSSSTRGRSSAILSRSENGEKENLKAESELAISAGYCSDAVSLPECCEPDPLTDTDHLIIDSSGEVPSFTPGRRSEASHEETAMAFATDVPAVFSQSGPYITPVTILRAHTQEVPSSSPPSSSPSMNLNFVPSSSPMPSSSPPLDGMAQTPPTSPSAATDAYEQGMTGADQEVIYAMEYISMLNRHFRSLTPLKFTLYIPNNSSISSTTLKVRYSIAFLGQRRN